jgi:hypothetical protein
MPVIFDGTPTPLRIVLTTVAPVQPAALFERFGAAIAAGAITSMRATDKAIRGLLLFMIHRISVWNNSLDLYLSHTNKEFLCIITTWQGVTLGIEIKRLIGF